MKKSDTRGFTLIELLVVIAIVGVLAAILFPILVSARESARRTKCQSNLKQIGNAFSSYVSDYSGYYPNTGDPYLWMGRRWRWPLKRYLALNAAIDPTAPYDPNKSVGNTGGILVCPSDPTAWGQYDGTSYGYSAAFYHTAEQINSMTKDQLWRLDTPGPECVSQATSQVSRPSKKAMVADWISAHSRDKVGWWDWRGERNYLFADGHIRYMRASAINKAKDDYPDINLTADGLRGQDIP